MPTRWIRAWPAALDTVSTWRYKPSLLNGTPVEITTTINVEFRLEN